MLKKLAKLIDVKSIVTFVLTGVFAYLSITGVISGEQFLTVFTMVVSFYFGTQAGKREKEEKRRKRILYESIRTAVATLLLLAVSLLTFAWFHHARPKERMSAGLYTATPTPFLSQIVDKGKSTPAPSAEADAPPATPEPTPKFVPWIEK